MYDRMGHQAFEGGMGGGAGGFGGFSAEDIFNQFGDIFGGAFGGGGRGQQRQRRGSDLRYVMELTLEEAVKGVKKPLLLLHQRHVTPVMVKVLKIRTMLKPVQPVMVPARYVCSKVSSRYSKPVVPVVARARSSRIHVINVMVQVYLTVSKLWKLLFQPGWTMATAYA